MKLIVLACLAAVALARPQEFFSEPEADSLRDRDRYAEITSFENQQTQDGGNINSFTATNGLERQEEIRLQEVRVINEDGQEEYRLVPFYTGSFKFPNPDGTFTERKYYTDETGIHFEGADLPVAPQPF
ncbi:Larval cuticle protein 16/17 [Amphibalanus amphitrite]|uniref:Larval cuticle protein 16/17 n=1 Tax=Amphibalanus amphitrite TaxID=1232801 RepID=A0A6A4X6T7_AMPAM|nr:larval cuticle protein 16/17-like [Amphibalanus amphitrite]KAF0311724.1 Larval cuticle protein 16/17 [Amphibalanus amphitrite]